MKKTTPLLCDSQSHAQTIDGYSVSRSLTYRMMYNVLIIALFQIAAPFSWAEKYIPYGHQFEPAPQYEEKRKPAPGRGTYLKDPNVWVYTSEFAERFGMPEQWVDNSLQGAEAVAYRIEQSNTQTCGFFGETENCRPQLFCVMDIYLKDEDGAKLPWESHKLSDWSDWDRSEMFLTRQRKDDDWHWYDETQNHRYIRRGPKGLRSVVYVSGKPKRLKSGTQQMFSSYSDLRMRSYRRDFFQGLDLLQLEVCSMANAISRPVSVYFLDPQPSMNEPQYRLPDGKVNRVKLDAAKKKQDINMNSGNPPHQVGLPDGYMDRVNVHDKAVRRERSLAAEAWRRYKRGDIEKKNIAPVKPSLWQRLFQ